MPQAQHCLCKLRNWNRKNKVPNNRAFLFGEDMTDQFRKGTSRSININDSKAIKDLVLDIFNGNVSSAAGQNEIIDQDTVFAISYRHCRDNLAIEIEIFLKGLMVASLLAKKQGKEYFRI